LVFKLGEGGKKHMCGKSQENAPIRFDATDDVPLSPEAIARGMKKLREIKMNKDGDGKGGIKCTDAEARV